MEKSSEAARGYGSPRTFTPAASEVGDRTADEPPTYAESVSAHSVLGHRAPAPRPTYNDNKIQTDDEFRGSSPSDSDEGSIVTLGDLAEDDETAWALDDEAAAAELPSYEDATNIPSEDELVREILANQHRHSAPSSLPSLPCPIIVPQRRPQQGSKGFVRAYAPILQTVGIDQDTFMAFLRNLHRSTRINPWFTAVMVSSTTIDTSPSAVAMAVATAMQFASEDGASAGRKTNNFLDRMNADMFKPCGCFAFITRYQEVTDAAEHESGFFGIAAANVDLTTNRVVPKYDHDEPSGLAGLNTRLKLFRLASDAVNNTRQSSSLAPLTFPHADHKEKAAVGDVKSAQASTDQPGAAEAAVWTLPNIAAGFFQSLTTGVASLHEHRTQRRAAREERWAHRHEKRQERREQRYERRVDRSQRRVERNAQRLESRYGRPASSTSTPSAATPIDRTNFGKSGEILYDHEDEARSEYAPPRTHHRRNRARRDEIAGRHRTKGLSEGVLYLMIVALPTEQELANARAMLQGE